MGDTLKRVFGTAALGLGSGGVVMGAITLLNGAWSTANEIGGVDLTVLGVLMTAGSAGVAYLGNRTLTKLDTLNP